MKLPNTAIAALGLIAAYSTPANADLLGKSIVVEVGSWVEACKGSRCEFKNFGHHKWGSYFSPDGHWYDYDANGKLVEKAPLGQVSNGALFTLKGNTASMILTTGNPRVFNTFTIKGDSCQYKTGFKPSKVNGVTYKIPHKTHSCVVYDGNIFAK